MTFLQQPIVFPFQPNYSRECFHISSCNALAFEAIESWPQWVDRILLIHGPSFSGKTHLAHLWQERSHACFTHLEAPFPPYSSLILDNLKSTDLTPSLFHFLNRVREEKKYCLILAQAHPLSWPCIIPDLTSRLKALVSFSLDPPDENHRALLLQKNLSDCQIRLTQRQAGRLLLHAERSYEGVKSILKSYQGNFDK